MSAFSINLCEINGTPLLTYAIIHMWSFGPRLILKRIIQVVVFLSRILVVLFLQLLPLGLLVSFLDVISEPF